MTDIQARELKEAFLAATRCLEQYRDTVDALNVFPVPDGDTGTNMLLTMRAGVEVVDRAPEGDADAVANLWANGVFMGARGNSGVILSQFFKGFAGGLAGARSCDSATLDRAFANATAAAYQAVSDPREGTMLTVIRRAGEALSWAVDEGLTAPLSLWKIAYEEARTALELTPTQLPALQEAGVVDSGGLGIVVILGGALDYLTTGSAGPAELELDTIPGIATTIHGGEAIVSGEFVHASQEVEWGYCTQFLVEGEGLSPDEFRQGLSGLADSVVVVGDEAIVRVHAHLLDPGHALSYGVERGQLSQIKIDNMSLQNQGWAAGHTSRAKPEPQSGVTVVAVAPGEGLAELFREAGCGAVVSGGQTMNPSIQQLIDAAGDTGVTDVIILPNNRNIVLTAEQAAQGSPDQQVIHVVPSRTAPQGVAALLAFNPTQSAEENVSAMQEAADSVLTVEVTHAVRNATVDGMSVVEGQFMGLLDGRLVAVSDQPEPALHEALQKAGLESDCVVTIYWGVDTEESAVDAVRDRLEELVPDIQVDTVYGGQPHYPYLASIE
jgi:DAK2 domain fusion protein YloV